VRVLKVDRYFVAGLGRNPEDDAIVQAVIALAHSLGLSATAEGVERIEQLNRLRVLDCDAAQGYLWSRAVSIEDFIPLVEAIRASAGDPVAQPVTVLSAATKGPGHTAAPIRPGPRRRALD
jgi:EAL domain-containing protein (putative c-di-GMP-specific phosphodiesterase class I)